MRYTTASTPRIRSSSRSSVERDPGVADLAPCAQQPGGHRRLGDEEGAGGLRRAQAAERFEGKRHARGQRQRGVAAREQQPQPVVGEGGVVVHRGVVGGARRGAVSAGEGLERADPLVERSGAAQPVDRAPPRRDGQPGGGHGRHAVAWPRGHGDGVRVLQGVLGQREVAAELAGQRRQDAGAVLAGGPLELTGGRQSKDMTGRTSTEP
jgi:hypothetical protein